MRPPPSTLAAAGLDQATVAHPPRRLSNNGASYIASDLATWFDNEGKEPIRAAPYRPQKHVKVTIPPWFPELAAAKEGQMNDEAPTPFSRTDEPGGDQKKILDSPAGET